MARPRGNAHSGKLAQAIASSVAASVKSNLLFVGEELVQLKKRLSGWPRCASGSAVRE